MFEAFIFGVFGLIVGSFLNVLILRWGERSLTGRSACPSCGKIIRWYDLIPVVSWFILRGRCRTCRAVISFQYVLVEAAVALMFVAIGLSPLALAFRIAALPIAALLVAIAVYDLRHTLIPDMWVYTAGALAFAISLYAAMSGVYEGNILYIVLAGPAVALPLFALWVVSRGAWMGLGDVKFAFTMGWLLGFAEGILALLLGFVLGALASLPLLFFSSSSGKRVLARFTPKDSSLKFHGRFTMKSEIPFGPFLIAATFVVWILNMYGISFIDFLNLYSAPLVYLWI